MLRGSSALWLYDDLSIEPLLKIFILVTQYRLMLLLYSFGLAHSRVKLRDVTVVTLLVMRGGSGGKPTTINRSEIKPRFLQHNPLGIDTCSRMQ